MSPEVWNDAHSRATAVCTTLEHRLIDPLMVVGDTSDANTPYWTLELNGSQSDRLGVGEVANEETGSVLLSLFIPKGYFSTPDALTFLWHMQQAFRVPDVDMPWPDGLFYDGHDEDFPSLDDRGNWYIFTLTIHYRYQTAIS